MSTTPSSLGNQGEALIAQQLERDGFSIIARNFHSKMGEIDIIARKGDVITFVEVKARRNPLFDMGEIVTPSKQKRIAATARYFLAKKNIIDCYCRFDVALLSYTNDEPEISYIKNAFTTD